MDTRLRSAEVPAFPLHKLVCGRSACLLTAELRKQAVDEFWKDNAPQLAAVAKQLSWPGGLARREALAAAAEHGRKTQGFLTKSTFDEILEWGFGKASNLSSFGIFGAQRAPADGSSTDFSLERSGPTPARKSAGGPTLEAVCTPWGSKSFRGRPASPSASNLLPPRRKSRNSRNLTEADIRAATKDAFDRLGHGDESGALRRLRELPGIGVSRASKILALSDQKNLGVYDSHAAAALESITQGDKPLIAVPPGRSRGLRDRPPVSQERLNRDYPKFTAALRRLVENARQDKRYAGVFKRVSDVERALFSSHRQEGAGVADTALPSQAPGGVGNTVRESVGAGLAGAAFGAVGDLSELRQGNLSWRDATKRRVRDGLRGGVGGAAASVAKRFGKATKGPHAHVQGGARAAFVGVVIGGVSEAGAVMRGELHPRDFAENRVLDAGEAGVGRLAGGGAVVLFAVAPFEAPAVVIGGSVVVVGVGVSRAARPVRRRASRRQESRRRARLEAEPDDGLQS